MSCCLWKTPLYVVRELRVKMADKHPSITKIVWLRKPIKDLGNPRVPRPHFENHCSLLLLQRIHSIAAFCFCFFPPHQVIDLINRYLGTGKKIVVFRGQFILPADSYLRVKGFSQYPFPRYRDRMILEPTYKASGWQMQRYRHVEGNKETLPQDNEFLSCQ